MLDKMKQLMDMKKQADKIKRELDGVSVDVEEVRGIKITINGSQVFQAVEIEEGLVESIDKKKLESHLLRSMNAAVKKSQNMAAMKMRDVMPGFPGM